ncbi:hypothetical protein NE237_003931 [Protea cynaroides]|uniref:t-SNARE coiled-coil homology domain-containing protein n=1 Tax=Protea cynaroides TaxID=273540 RepID=A0A9Q0KHX8_9MAGN|nr:hypothetical protein NE237_003931 [Protea cynaroides]
MWAWQLLRPLSELRGERAEEETEGFHGWVEQISGEYRETVEQKYYTVEVLISTRESETFLQKAIQKQGRGQIVETIWEIEERHDAMKEMEKSLEELHRVFLDVGVVVEQQGEQLDNIKWQVARANSTPS